MSSTVVKALALLDHFSEEEPEIGLSELARRSGIDKATVHRMLAAMSDSGLVEQRGSARAYRLGAGVLRLARVRETAYPVSAVYEAAIETLMQATDETAHASLISGRALATIGICESNRGSRVSLVAGEVLPFHSTASGKAALAYASPAFRDRILSGPLERRTAQTITDRARMEALLDEIRAQGFAVSDQANEDDVYGIAVPVFDAESQVAGAIAVATPAHRMTEEKRVNTIRLLLAEGEKTTFGVGGRCPPEFSRAAARSLDALE